MAYTNLPGIVYTFDSVAKQPSGGARIRLVHEHRFHRKDAKIAEKFFNKNNKTLCFLGIVAVSLILMEGHENSNRSLER